MPGFVFRETPEEIVAARMRVSLRRLLEIKYNADQPRVPAGNPGGGRWTDGLGEVHVRVAANGGPGPLGPAGIYSVPVAHNPMDPAQLNPKAPLSSLEQQQVADAVNELNAGGPAASLAMQVHEYENRPDKNTGAVLPPSASGYSTYYIGPKTGKQRLLIDKATGQMYYTNNHYLSFWPIFPLPK